MKNLIVPVLLVSAIFLFSCGEKGWPEDHKEAFLTNCVKGYSQHRPVEEAEKFCDCALEKIQKAYPDPKDFKADDEEALKLSDECIKELETTEE